MPDLLTHLALAEGVRRGVRGAGLTSWFLIGTVLPDVLTRSVYIPFPGLVWFVMPLHTPLGLVLVCAFISRCCSPPQRRQTFKHLSAGAALHLVLDICQKHMGGGYALLFPFSWSSVEIGLVWPETSLYLAPLWLALAAFLIGHWLLRRQAHG
jgi:hypothetical protein